MSELVCIKEVEPYVSPAGYKHRMFLYKCYCGNEFVSNPSRIKSGNTSSCGCLHKRQLAERSFKHGLSETPIYKAWANMLQRCYGKNKKQEVYRRRGIKVCERWRTNFIDFYNDVYPSYKEGLSLDREDNDGDYGPDNFRWITQADQVRNRSFNNRVNYDNDKGCVMEMCRKYNVSYNSVYRNMKRGLSFKEAVDRLRLKNYGNKHQSQQS